MTEAEVIRYMRQVCDGLQHMHEQNIVHLDLKVRRDSCRELTACLARTEKQLTFVSESVSSRQLFFTLLFARPPVAVEPRLEHYGTVLGGTDFKWGEWERNKANYISFLGARGPLFGGGRGL